MLKIKSLEYFKERFEIVTNDSDGNCLFYSLDLPNHAALRSEICRFYKNVDSKIEEYQEYVHTDIYYNFLNNYAIP